jgi:hypothetical protein
VVRRGRDGSSALAFKMDILNELSKDAKIKEACKKIGYPNHDDLYQELFIILCELHPDKLHEIYSNGYIHFWIVRTLINMTSPNGKFYKKYKVIYDDTEAITKLTEPSEEVEQVYELETKRAEAEKLLSDYEKRGQSSGGWYKVNLLRTYTELGSARKVEALTGISYRTVCKDVNEFIKELRTNLNASGC